MVTRRAVRKGGILLSVVMLVAYAAMALFYLRHPRDTRRTTRNVASTAYINRSTPSYYGQGVTTLCSYCPPGGRSRRGGGGSESCSSCDSGYGQVVYANDYGTPVYGGGCANGQCSYDTYHWGNESDGYIALYKNGRQVGGFYLNGFWAGQYLGYQNGRWDNIDSDLPVSLPAQYQSGYRGRVGQMNQVQQNQPNQVNRGEQKAPAQQQPATTPNIPNQVTPKTTEPVNPSVGQLPGAVSQADAMKKQIEELTKTVNELKLAKYPVMVQDVLPEKQKEQGQPSGNPNGIDLEGMKKDLTEPGTTINGRKSTEQIAYGILDRNGWGGTGDIPDFTTKNKLYIIGTEAQRAEAIRCIKEMFPAGIEGVIIQEYDSNDAPLLRQVNFPTEGAPGIVMQRPNDGGIIWRLASTNGLSARLAQLRKPNDGYRPERDPMGPPLFADESTAIPYVVGGLAFIVMVMFVVGIIVNMLRTPQTENRQWLGSGY